MLLSARVPSHLEIQTPTSSFLTEKVLNNFIFRLQCWFANARHASMRAIANLCPHSCICSSSSSFTSRRNHLTCYHKAEESRHHAAVTRPRGQTFSRSGSASGQLLLSWAAGRGIFRARASSSLGGARCVQPLKLRPKSDQRAHLTWRALKLYWEIQI